jgi:two-component system invasion response regulator UvrY
MSITPKLNVAILEDHSITRFGIEASINAHPNYVVVHTNDEALDYINYVEKYAATLDLCVVDIFLPGAINGIGVLKRIKAFAPLVKILILSSSNSKIHRKTCLRNGACGYILKNDSIADFHTALSNIKAYNFAQNPWQIIPESISSLPKELDLGMPDFSEEEIALIKLFCTSLTYPAIADKLATTAKVIDHKREKLFKKCNVTTRTSLVYFAFQIGLLNAENADLF